MRWKESRTVSFDSITELHSIYIANRITQVISREQQAKSLWTKHTKKPLYIVSNIILKTQYLTFVRILYETERGKCSSVMTTADLPSYGGKAWAGTSFLLKWIFAYRLPFLANNYEVSYWSIMVTLAVRLVSLYGHGWWKQINYPLNCHTSL